MPVQLQYIQSITDKTNAADLSSGVFAILTSVTRTKKIQNSLSLHKFRQNWQQLRTKGSAELYCLFTAADNIVDAISFIRRIVL